MSKGKPRDLRKERRWRRLLAQRDRSGLSVRAFCQLHDLSEPSFYAWRCTLRERDAQAVHFVPVELVADEHAARATDGSAKALELVLSDGLLLRVGTGFDGPTLKRLLALLEEGRPC
jgi:transposase-like protein